MAAVNFTSTLSLQYTPPGAPVNSGVASLAVNGTYQAGQSGYVDIPPGTVVASVLPIPFGSVSAAKVLIVQNKGANEVGVRLNGHSVNDFNIPPGGSFAYIVPSEPGAVPLTSASIVTIVDPTTNPDAVYFWCFGD